MVKKHQQILNDRQIEILYTLATKGKQNKSQLSSKFDVEYPAIVGSVKILEDKKLVRIAHKEKGVGKPKVFYEITDAGLEILSTEPRINLEKFWEIAFLIYGHITKDDSRFPAGKFFSNYERNVIGYSPEYTTLSWSFVIDSYDFLYKRPIKHSIFTMVLYTLAINGKLSENRIISTMLNSNDPYLSIPTSKNEIIQQLHNMISNKLILTTFGKEIKYRISSLGMLILLHHLIDRMHENTSRRFYDDLELTLQKIAHQSQFVIPMVFSYWNDLLKIESTANLLLRFSIIGNDHIPISNSVQQGGTAEILLMEKMLVKSNSAKIKLEHMAGIETLRWLFREKRYPEGLPSEATLRLTYLGILNQYRKEDSRILEYVTKKKNYSLEEEADKSLANIIAFEFYLHLIDMIKSLIPREQPEIELGPELSKTFEWFQAPRNNWNNFVNKNTELIKWYEGWIKHIMEFERKNIKILDDKLGSSRLLMI